MEASESLFAGICRDSVQRSERLFPAGTGSGLDIRRGGRNLHGDDGLSEPQLTHVCRRSCRPYLRQTEGILAGHGSGVSPTGGSAKPAGENPLSAFTDADIVASFLPFNPVKIILFGSMARDDHDEDSDVDVIVVYNSDKKFLDRLAELYENWSLPRGVDILAYTPMEFEEMLEESSFIVDAVNTGKVIYEKSC